jgi:TatD DNase family protein
LDARFTKGIYRGTFRHDPDLDLILQRAADVGVKRIVLTAGTVEESRHAVSQAREWNKLYPAIHFSCTVGVHPTRCKESFVDNDANADALLNELLEIAKDGMEDGTVVVIGEIGLDFDRLQFCPADIQREYFKRQLECVAQPTGLPLFLHNRSVGDELLAENRDWWKKGGVVHSFDDTLELGTKLINDLGLYIGLNGCSLRTEECLQHCKELPLGRLLLETE